ncbi:hypothetical protein BBO99_00000701 [Phytophthora kernoviae]|uniref:VPS9 domain-containing protein n=2 Tax=Phytophthora kernoviae TaxID=325452 RepID=A0A3R7I1K9_9STRA|nr:hypothetical protein G195_003193 [Phytophthora kernoviae 00238/432]KAG2524665.1 hypothetical protein JM16_004519 [Phytophthora kernoviae]KAG2525969.1 hypothetical protein JM18_004506 [Phytophthora kernoviae]RLN27357.1 hypothetical protein BBI17_002756 [Phytophthora kernoviae]RLN85215.1 hypothetical protein BBO99_00000701 [Phytophthora kernoviae]
MSGVAGRRDERAGSATEIECEELQPTEAEIEPGWRRLLKPGRPTLAPVPPTLSLQDLAQSKEVSASEEDHPPSTLAGHVMWKLAMKMSNHYENRLSVRVVRCETVSAMPAVTEYVVHVVDLHTRVFWITKKRFSDFYFLRRKVRGIIRHAPEADNEEKDYLRFLLDLPFPRRRFRPASATAISRGMGEIEVFLRNLAALEPDSKLQRSLLKELQLEMCSDEFVSSLEKIDTTAEIPEPKWLTYDLFRRLNCEGAVEGSTCYKFLQVFRNRVATIESTLCTQCNKFEGATLAAAAVGDLRNTVSSIEKYIGDHLDPQYADTLSLLDQSVNVPSILEDCIFHAVEDTVVVPLEKQVAFLVGTSVDKEAEQRLVRNIERLRCRSQAESGIPEHLQSDDNWGLSCHHLSMIDERALPVDKIHELLRSALEIFKNCGEKNLEWHDNSALTADDYLPIHIYVVVNSGLKRPLATKELLGAMIHPSLMLGEVGYFLTMFEVALKYIADM